LDNNLAGLPAKKFHLESMFPCEFHVDSMWNHLESMGEGKVLPTTVITVLTKSAMFLKGKKSSDKGFWIPEKGFYILDKESVGDSRLEEEGL
jgi:hypothetical protein